MLMFLLPPLLSGSSAYETFVKPEPAYTSPQFFFPESNCALTVVPLQVMPSEGMRLQQQFHTAKPPAVMPLQQ